MINPRGLHGPSSTLRSIVDCDKALGLGAHVPALAPLEPQMEGTPYQQTAQSNASALAGDNQRSAGMSLADIISRPDGSRKLPVPQMPKVSVHDLLSNEGYSNSGRSSATGSVAGGDLMERI